MTTETSEMTPEHGRFRTILDATIIIGLAVIALDVGITAASGGETELPILNSLHDANTVITDWFPHA